MKKLIVILLTLVMILGLTGCKQKEQPAQQGVAGTGFRVGYGRSFITPEENLPLGGFGTASSRIMEDVLDDIYVTTIAMTDANNKTLLLMCVDLQRIDDTFISLLRMSVNNATGVPEDQIIITCSHTHSIPDLTWDGHEGIIRYKNLLMERFAESATAAIADSKPATMYVGSAEANGLNFVKHYQVVDENGDIQHFGDNFGTELINDTTKHVTDAYNTMHLLQFKREGGKDVVIANYRSHPTLTGGASILDLSSDFIGPMRESVEDQLDCHFAYIQGACGNINPRSRLNNENFGTEKDHRDYGYRLANVAVNGVQNNMIETSTGLIQHKKTMFTATVDHSQDSMRQQAMLVTQMWNNTHNSSETNAYGRQFGISSRYHASAINIKANLPETQQIELSTFSIGKSVGFFAAPGELFDQVSVEMEEASPFDMTVTVGFADGDWKYFPYGPCAEYASYESDYGRFVPNTADAMMEIWKEELNNQYANAQ